VLKDKRLNLSTAKVNKLSGEMASKAVEILNMLSFSSLHIYLPKEELHEVNTWPLIEEVKRKWPEVKIAYTPFAGAEGGFRSLWLKDDSEVAGGFQFDIIIVPQLGFDDNGYRLGYGGGFYDRFLATQKTEIVMGLCFDFGHFTSLPHEAHDIPIKKIVTEEKVYTFS